MKRLVSFDWAAKKLLRIKANFGILEGFLSELLYEDIKIKQLLESEYNKDTKDSKYNRVDLLVENSKKELIIIEIQNQYESDYFQRMLFGTSKLIVDYLPEGSDYKEVKKVISVHIVYFDIGQGEDYIYKGTTNFIGLNKHDVLGLSNKQKDMFKKEFISEILPEYYIIKVNQFNDKAKNTLDQWIYFLKNEDIKENFKAKGIVEAKSKLDVLRMTNAERRRYDNYIMAKHDEASWNLTFIKEPMMEGFQKGHEKGLEEGMEKGMDIKTHQHVISMHKENIPIDTINKITGLSKEEVEQIINDNVK